MTKDEYREKIRAILIRFQKDELQTVNRTVDEIVDQIVDIELPDDGEFVVHGTYFPHNDKKKVLDRRAE
ncbi:hypothetical protein ES705_22623 [subsurface metagenome]